MCDTGSSDRNFLSLSVRVDFEVIASLINSGTRALDVGCGDGALLELLAARQNIDGRGIELSRQGVDQCLVKGLSVVQEDADRDLVYYPDDGFDYVILSQTLQATRNPRTVLYELLRIGRRAVVSISQFRSLAGSCVPASWRPYARHQRAALQLV